MSVQDTSREAYHNDVEPHLSDKQREVYIALQMSKRPINNQEVADYLGWLINTVTPRMNELVEMGKAEEAFRAVYPKTNRRTIYWQVAKNQTFKPTPEEEKFEKLEYEEVVVDGERMMRVKRSTL